MSLTWERKQTSSSRKYRESRQGSTPKGLNRHIVVKMAKIEDKESILKSAREKQQVSMTETPVSLWTDFSVETLQTRKQWHNILNLMKMKNITTKNILPIRI